MFHTLFARLMSMFLAVILIVLIFFSSISFFTIRNTVINNRMEELKKEARDIAYLLGNIESSKWPLEDNLSLKYLKRKIAAVEDEYGAYILTVDRNGKILDNFAGIYKDNYSFASTLNPDKVYMSLMKILAGEEIYAQNLKTSDVVFSIGVPFIKDNMVQGAVFIHTAGQKIQAEYLYIALIIISILFISVAISGIIAAVFTKKLVDPLQSMEVAVDGFSKGNFERRAEEIGSIETKSLAHSFNIMADKIQENDASRRDFVANVSHELRSPVTSINGYLTGIIDKTIPEDKIPYYLDIISQETLRLRKLIDDLLSLSRLEKQHYTLNLSNFNINEAIRRTIINKIGEIEDRNIEIDTNFQQEPIIVAADYDRILQVLTNLLDNSIKFVADSGYIGFSVRLDNSKAIITIKDNGAGIAKEDIPYIFDRFYKQDKSRSHIKGTGLGLSICKQIIELHNESIMVLPSEEGASFEFTLKLHKE